MLQYLFAKVHVHAHVKVKPEALRLIESLYEGGTLGSFEADEAMKADEAAWEEENRLPLQQRADDHRLAELWRARELAERAEPVCVCVCGKCWKGGVSPLASQFGSLSVATVNAMV